MSGGAIAAIVVACVAAILGVALVIVLAVNSIGNSAEDQADPVLLGPPASTGMQGAELSALTQLRTADTLVAPATLQDFRAETA
jgi:hypothetical protein